MNLKQIPTFGHTCSKISKDVFDALEKGIIKTDIIRTWEHRKWRKLITVIIGSSNSTPYYFSVEKFIDYIDSDNRIMLRICKKEDEYYFSWCYVDNVILFQFDKKQFPSRQVLKSLNILYSELYRYMERVK